MRKLIAKLFKNNKTIQQFNNSRLPKGFTLVELLVVISIIGVVIGIGTASLGNAQQKGRDSKRKSDIKQLQQAFELYLQTYGRYPTSNGGLITCSGGAAGTGSIPWGAAFQCPPGTGPVFMQKLPKDPKQAGLFTRLADRIKEKVTDFTSPVNAANTTVTTVDSAGSVGTYSSIAIPTGGFPIISYISPGIALKVVKCGDAACSSGNTITTVATGNIQYATSIAVGSDGLPILTHIDESAGQGLIVTKCGNAICSSGNTTTVVFQIAVPPSPYSASIAIGADGLPVIAYARASGSNRLIKCGNASCSSGNIDTQVGSGNENSPRVAIGTDGLPIIAYRDAADWNLKATHCGNASCSSGNITTDLFIGGVDNDLSIAIGQDGFAVIPFAAFDDLWLIKCTNTACSSFSITLVESVNNVGDNSSIAIGTDGLPFISYYDATNGDLRAVKCSNTACSSVNTFTSIDTTGNVGQFTSAKIGADDLPVISYYDATNADLKVAKCGTAACPAPPPPPPPPTVYTDAETGVTYNSATLNGHVNPNGESTDAWFRYSSTNPVTCNDTFGTKTAVQSVGNGSMDVYYNQPVSSLSASTTYYYCAIAANPGGTAFGLIRQFTTPAPPPPPPSPTPPPPPSPSPPPLPPGTPIYYYVNISPTTYVLSANIENMNDPDFANVNCTPQGGFNFCVKEP